MATNSFYCYGCGKYTKHISLSYREYSAMVGDGVLEQTAATIADVTGMGKVLNTVTGIRFWKCCDCGRHTRRKANGDSY